MEVIRENLWNKLFHIRQVRQQRREVRKNKQLSFAAMFFIQALDDCEDLHQILEVHKDLWGSGFQNKNLGPDDCGMFRTKDILHMKPEEVYLGNIYGLWTFNIPEWDKHKGEPVGSNGFGLDQTLKVYGLIMNQYRQLLSSNIRAIKKEAEEYITLYEAVNG